MFSKRNVRFKIKVRAPNGPPITNHGPFYTAAFSSEKTIQ